jgi:hypothetical protein
MEKESNVKHTENELQKQEATLNRKERLKERL